MPRFLRSVRLALHPAQTIIQHFPKKDYMNVILLFGIVLIISAWSCKPTRMIGLPILIGFIFIGILIGNWFKFDNMSNVNFICDFALLLIIFTGGFQTNFKEARPVVPVASVLSAAGTVLTAFTLGFFAYYVMRLDFYQAMLLGAVISSTDSASVFSVLRSKQLDLKNNLAPLLEIESGSNDPFAYMLTSIFLTLALGGAQNALYLLATQLFIGVIVGISFAKAGQFLINRLNVDIDGLYGVMLCGAAFLIYGVASQLGGNGFLAAYIGGIIIGNVKLVYKGSLSKLYSAVSMLMQILLFIVLGILCVPSSIVKVIWPGLLIATFLTFIARPVIIFALMKPFRRPLNDIALVSWAGFRGASSIVFATYVLIAGLPYSEYIFSVVFFVCMLSVIIQGTFITQIAKKLRLIDE
jgi:cell volume regulation protein A